MTDSTENKSGKFFKHLTDPSNYFKQNEYLQKYLHSFNVKIFPARKCICQQLRPNDREKWQMNLKKVCFISFNNYVDFLHFLSQFLILN